MHFPLVNWLTSQKPSRVYRCDNDAPVFFCLSLRLFEVNEVRIASPLYLAGIRGKKACGNQLMPLILIDTHLAVILSYFRREEEEYIRMILDQFRLKKYGHSKDDWMFWYVLFTAWCIYQWFMLRPHLFAFLHCLFCSVNFLFLSLTVVNEMFICTFV